ncbi:sulfate adenylyltransferase subunit CysD [Silanimonas sp.]|uniref:sulfate adenylyltransferase subunit CysD n=1 Tax=Silanimonas sp. TaxID=1929290 RepID=UPI0022C34550|nr:sulfate adenylyltransferase subunit CysD [Silanimonas sp.]MCZ8165898.1 sulfate adenylyltransferase subunit CysD [Silanimonas sp.]
MALSHLDRLEAESLHILREVAAQFRNPVLLYSIGKDSTVLLHLLKKAFYPARPPIPLLHIDSTFEFRQTYEFRDQVPDRLDVELRVHINEDGLKAGINPFIHGAAVHTDVMRTQGLRQALARGGYDCAIGGARRDEEKSRAKERVFSFRDTHQRWDPKAQRPEFWDLYNGRIHKGESVRAFPISNWTELDVWLYILREGIELPPLYFAETRPVVERDGTLIMVDDERLPLQPGERPAEKKVRFRTLGCYPLTGGIESEADSVEAIVEELLVATTSERQGRVIDHDPNSSMELKKLEGYF